MGAQTRPLTRARRGSKQSGNFPRLSEFLQQLLNGLSLGAIYALIALGYTMVYGVLRFINTRGVTVTGNKQPLSGSAVLATFSGSTNVTYSP